VPEEKDLYAILGVARDVDEDDLRQSYRRLAREYHPDVNPGDAKAEERFKEISAAYAVLSDSEKRARYDEFGMAGLQDGFDPEQAREYAHWARGAGQSPFHQQSGSGMDFDDLLSQLFGATGRGGRYEPGPMPGADAVAEVEIDFLQAVRSEEMTLQLVGRPSLRVRIPAGADSGTRIRLAGQGEPGPRGGPPGDLYLQLRIRPHRFFTREGDDLHVDVPVTVPELIRGASIDVPTPDGNVSLKVPPRSQNGRKLRLREKGAKRRGGGSGDLYVRLQARLPESDDLELDRLAESMEALYGEADVRQALRER